MDAAHPASRSIFSTSATIRAWEGLPMRSACIIGAFSAKKAYSKVSFRLGSGFASQAPGSRSAILECPYLPRCRFH